MLKNMWEAVVVALVNAAVLGTVVWMFNRGNTPSVFMGIMTLILLAFADMFAVIAYKALKKIE